MKEIKCKITKAHIGGFTTDFTIKINDEKHGNSPESLIHRIGDLAEKRLEELVGLEFTVKVNK